MNQYKHLLALDLSSYGAALAIVNQFVDDAAVKVFEISPCGQSAVLILVSKENISLQIIKAETNSIFRSQVLSSALIENVHEELLPTYLSQNKARLSHSLIILESSSVATCFFMADKLLKAKYSLIDFRVVRTFPKNVILSVGTDNLSQPINFSGLDFKKTYIENIQPILKNFYEV